MVTLVIALVLCICMVFYIEMGVHDSVMHSRVHHLGSQLESTSILMKPDVVDDANQNDSLLQPSLYIINSSNSNDNSNTSTGVQSDIIRESDITSVSIPESHGLVASVSNISKTSTRSEFISSSHPLTNNVHSQTETGMYNNIFYVKLL